MHTYDHNPQIDILFIGSYLHNQQVDKFYSKIQHLSNIIDLWTFMEGLVSYILVYYILQFVIKILSYIHERLMSPINVCNMANSSPIQAIVCLVK